MFITFEGGEGAGKTTLIRRLSERLGAEGREVIVTREPGAGTVGSAIRQILLHGEELDSRAELFLFLADRAQHITNLVRPALQRGAWVFCDRHADSTVVYQGYGRGLDLDQLREWNHWATGGLKPDLTLLLDIDPEVGLTRITDKDRLDAEPLEFHRRIRAGFRKEAEREPNRWIVLDASTDPDSLAEAAYSQLSKHAHNGVR